MYLQLSLWNCTLPACVRSQALHRVECIIKGVVFAFHKIDQFANKKSGCCSEVMGNNLKRSFRNSKLTPIILGCRVEKIGLYFHIMLFPVPIALGILSFQYESVLKPCRPCHKCGLCQVAAETWERSFVCYSFILL